MFDLDLYKSVGVGIRWNSPMGPLRLEYGYPLDNLKDNKGKFEFSVGTFFLNKQRRSDMRKVLMWVLMLSFVWANIGFCENYKIGVVDLQYVLEKCEAGKAAIAKLQTEFKSLKEKLDKKKAAIDKLRQQLDKQRLMLTQEAQIDKELEYKQKVQEFKTLYSTYQQKMQIKERQLREPIVKELEKVLKQYGKEKNFTLIIDKRNSGVVYNSPKIEITKEVIVKFNQAWRARKKNRLCLFL